MSVTKSIQEAVQSFDEVIAEEGSPVVDGADAVSTAVRHFELGNNEKFLQVFSELSTKASIITVAIGAGIGNFFYQMHRASKQKRRTTANYLEDKLVVLKSKTQIGLATTAEESNVALANEFRRDPVNVRFFDNNDLARMLNLAEDEYHPKSREDFYVKLKNAVRKNRAEKEALKNKMLAELGDSKDYALCIEAADPDLPLSWSRIKDPKQKFAAAKKVLARIMDNKPLYEIKVGKKIEAAKAVAVVEPEPPVKGLLNKAKKAIGLIWESSAIFISIFWVMQWIAARFTTYSLMTENFAFAAAVPEAFAIASIVIPVVLTVLAVCAAPIVAGIVKLKNLLKQKFGKKTEMEEDKGVELEEVKPAEYDFKSNAEVDLVKHKLMRQVFAKAYYDQLRFKVKPVEIDFSEVTAKIAKKELGFADMPEPAQRLLKSKRRDALVAISVCTGFLFGAAIIFGVCWPLGAFLGISFAAVSIATVSALAAVAIVGGISAWRNGKKQLEKNQAEADLVVDKKEVLAKLKHVETLNTTLREQIKVEAKKNNIQDLKPYLHGMPLEGQVRNDRFWRAMSTEPLPMWKKAGNFLREVGLKMWTLSYATRATMGFLGFGGAVSGLAMIPISGLLVLWGGVRWLEYKFRKGAENDLKYVQEAEQRLEAATREHAILQTVKADVVAGKPSELAAPEVSAELVVEPSPSPSPSASPAPAPKAVRQPSRHDHAKLVEVAPLNNGYKTFEAERSDHAESFRMFGPVTATASTTASASSEEKKLLASTSRFLARPAVNDAPVATSTNSYQ